MTGPFGSGSFGTSTFSSRPLFSTKDIIDAVLRDTGHTSVDKEISKRLSVLGFINNKYAEISARRHWDWLYQTADFNFIEPYHDGTINCVQNSDIITGNATNWSSDIVGWTLIIADEVYEVASVESSTSLTMTSKFTQGSENLKAYFLVKNTFVLPPDCDHAQSILVDRMGEMVPLGTQEFERKLQYNPAYIGAPRYFTETGRRSQDGVRNIKVYPNPDKFYNVHLDYGVTIMRLEDSADSYPLVPDRHRVVLYYGALAEMYRYLRDASSAASADNDFMKCFVSMCGDQQITDSRLIIANGKNYLLRKRRRGRYRLSMDSSDFSRYE